MPDHTTTTTTTTSTLNSQTVAQNLQNEITPSENENSAVQQDENVSPVSTVLPRLHYQLHLVNVEDPRQQRLRHPGPAIHIPADFGSGRVTDRYRLQYALTAIARQLPGPHQTVQPNTCACE